MPTRLMNGVHGALGALLVMCAPGSMRYAVAEPIIWEAYTYNAVATIVPAKGFREICEQIEKESGGRLQIKFHLGGSLQIKVDTITQAVSENLIQIADDAFFSGAIPIGGLVRLPMLLRDDAEYMKAAAVLEPYVKANYEKSGVAMLGAYYYPQLTIWSRKSIASLSDIENQKIRVPSLEYGEFIKRFKGVTVTMGVPQVPSALERSVVDGVVTSSTLGGLTWKDLLKYNYRVGISYANSNIIVNGDAFKKLPDDLQEIVRKVVSDVTPSISANLAKEESETTRQLAAGGIVVTEPGPADVRTATERMTPYWDEWAKQRGVTAVDALAKIRSTLGR